LFAAAALVLSIIGIYGVMGYYVQQQLKEISIRMALGARAGQVLQMIVGRAVALATVGTVLGILGAVAIGRVIQTQLFGVGILDPLTLTTVVVVLIGSAAAASFLPARRAARLDPADALRES
jgi:ABC-type antimicrobial peptide transport system permease subunit